MASHKQQKLLHYVEEGRVLKAKAYLKKHRNLGLNFKVRKGRTPLHLACALQNDALTRLLLKHGADPLIQDNRGNTALHVAAMKAATHGKKVYKDLVIPLQKHCPAAMKIANYAGKLPQDFLKRERLKKPTIPPWASEEMEHSDEEQAFQAKLFGECMDEYQESFGQYDDDFSRANDEPESHFEWAERIAREYNTKRRQADPILKAKEAAAAKKKQRERQREELLNRFEEEHRQYQQRARLIREELTRSKQRHYERRCASVFAQDATRQLQYRDIPWPGGSRSSVKDMIGVITQGVDTSNKSTFRSYLRRQQALWHPDKFQQRCGARLMEDDRQRIFDTVMALSQSLNKLAEDAK